MKFNRGQLSIFFLLCVSLLFIIFLTYYLLSLESSTVAKGQEQVLAQTPLIPLQSFMDSCLQKVADEGILTIGILGGHYASNIASSNSSFPIPLYLSLPNTEDNVPSREFVESELGRYVQDNLPLCLDGFSPLSSQGYGVSLNGLRAKASLNEGSTAFELDFDLQVNHGGQTLLLRQSFYDSSASMGRARALAQEFIGVQIGRPNEAAVGDLAALAYENNFTFSMTMLDDGLVLYTFLFNESSPFPYNFLVEYSLSAKKQEALA